MISYADLEKAFRQERSVPTLQKLGVQFYNDAKSLAANPDVGDYKENISQYLEKIYYLRANKIIHYAGRAGPGSKPPENILPSEITLYNMLLEAVAQNKASILDSAAVVPAPSTKQLVKTRILQALPAIAGSDSKEYGPFKEDDLADLPEDTAALLIQRKVAERVL